jgi:hypothetical protein
MTTTANPLTARNATLEDMVAILRDQRARRLDVVAPASAVHAHDGNLIIDGTVQHVAADGVTSAAGTYRPTQVAEEGLSASSASPWSTSAACAASGPTCGTRT